MIPRNHRQAERVLIQAVREGILEIDEEGRVWRRGRVRRAEKRLQAGYLQVQWMRARKRTIGLAHRLVWQHVHGDIPDGLVINHKNGIKDDNRPANLECVTYSDNTKHAHRLRLRDQRGDGNPAAKLSRQSTAAIREMYAGGGWTMEALGARFGVSFQAVSKIVRGQRRATDGGPMSAADLRHSACPRDPVSQRFVSPSSGATR